MAMATSGQLSLGTTAGTDRSIGAAVSGYTNTQNISLKDVSNAASAGTNPADGAPFEMEEFYGYAEVIPTTVTSYVTLSTSSRAFKFFDYRHYNGTTIAAVSWDIDHKFSTVGNNYRHEWFIQRNNADSVNVYGHSSVYFLNAGESNKLKIAQVDVPTSFGRPDSYRLNESISSSSSGPFEPLLTNRDNGDETFEDNPPNTDYTYPTLGSSAIRETGQGVFASQLSECFSGSGSHEFTYTLVYKKTGYQDSNVFSFRIGADFTFNHYGLCP